MKELTSNERIMRIFKNEPVDRPAFKLWGAYKAEENEAFSAYSEVDKLASEITDLFGGGSSPFNVYYGRYIEENLVETTVFDNNNPAWTDYEIIYHTPLGDLKQIERVSKYGEPGLTVSYPVKDENDLKKLISIPYKPYDFSRDNFDDNVLKMGERGVVMFNLDHAAFSLQRMTGSENLAILSIDNRGLVDEAIAMFSQRIINHTKAAIESGIKAPFAWVGPELFIPPLLSPNDFNDFVYKYDKPLCDVIHNSGGYIWVHCHGKVKNFLESFVNMGVDIINPLEPPKNGDIMMNEIVNDFGGKIGLEGNIEIQEIIQSDPEHLKEIIRTCVKAGVKSGRFILCQSAGYKEYIKPSQQYINNLMIYLKYGYECVNNI